MGGILVAIGGVRGGLSIWREASPVDATSIVLWTVGGVLLAVALVAPGRLAVPNLLWRRLGFVLSRVVNPVVLLLLYATCIVPIGLAMRLFGHDPLRLKHDADADTWWIARKPSPTAEPMRHQF